MLEEDEIKQTPEAEKQPAQYELRSLEEILAELDEKLQQDSSVAPPRRKEALTPELDPVPQEEAMKIPRRRKRKSEEEMSWQESLMVTLHDTVSLFAVTMVIFILLFRIVVVNGSSMYETLWHNDVVLVMSNVISGAPEFGDIIVASKDSFNDGEPIIKRVIATEGQTVDIDFYAGIVYVDGQALEEDYTYTATYESDGVAFPLVVPEGCIFVMGDNRNRSRDSRYPDIGFIDEREVLGKAFFVLVPGTGDGDNEAPRDFSRIGVLK